MFTVTPEFTEGWPTKALSDFGSALEGLERLTHTVDDCEGFIVACESGLQSAIHVIDAELQRRPGRPLTGHRL